MCWAVDRLCSAIYGDVLWCRECFSCLPKNNTYEIISSIHEMGIGVISGIQPWENSWKIILEWNIIGIHESEGSQKDSQK